MAPWSNPTSGRLVKQARYAFILALAGASTLPGVVTADLSAASFFDYVAQRAVADLGGDLDASVAQAVYRPDGTVMTREMPLRDALAILGRTLGDAPISTDDTDPSHALGVGYADPAVAFALQWGFCDGASIHAAYGLDRAPPGSAFHILAPGWETSALVGGTVCGEVAYDWDDVTIDSRSIAGPKLPCGGAQVLVDYANAAFDRGLVGGILCHHDVMSAHGKGTVGTWVLGLTVVDYFIGSAAYIEIGDNPS